MRFIDEVSLKVRAGRGGDGCVSFRREKFVPKGGPDGGHGGDGGNVLFQADEGINTLAHFRGIKEHKAQSGLSGEGGQRNGKKGDDLILKVPVGTLVFDQESQQLIADLTEHGSQTVIATGGRGGLGNAYFKSSTNQAPRYAQPGLEGDCFDLRLELKLLADIALVGLPNAGKSTLISALSSARPKVADYPFTTLTPQLGVMQFREHSVVIADIPGLIEGAAEGKGLGHQFLRHIERGAALVHLIDISMLLSAYEAMENYLTIRGEMEQFSKELLDKKEIVCLTKIDAMTEETIELFRKELEEQLGKKVLPLSAVSQRGIDELKQLMIDVSHSL